MAAVGLNNTKERHFVLRSLVQVGAETGWTLRRDEVSVVVQYVVPHTERSAAQGTLSGYCAGRAAIPRDDAGRREDARVRHIVGEQTLATGARGGRDVTRALVAVTCDGVGARVAARVG